MANRPKSYRALRPQQRAANMKRPDKFYTGTDWRKVRRIVLDASPICVIEGCTEAATHVDHIIPRTWGGADYALSNLQPLCHGCHSRKTRNEERAKR